MTNYKVNMSTSQLFSPTIRSYPPRETGAKLVPINKKNVKKSPQKFSEITKEFVLGEIMMFGATALIASLGALKHIKCH